jgi:hypothetical protein
MTAVSIMEKGGSMMLKVTRRPHPAVIVARAAMTLTIAVFAGLASAGSAFADHAQNSEPPTLKGDWAPLNRCPVDDPAMLAAGGVEAGPETSRAACLSDISPSGSTKIGNLTVATKGSNHQFGVILHEGFTVIPPAGGVLLDEPVQLPGGLRELVCPSSGHVARWICHHSHGGGWDAHRNAVAWTLESAGTPTNFNLFAGLAVGVPFASIPVKIHLQNQLLGDDCYIGSDAEPIVIQPSNAAEPIGGFELFNADGTPEENGPFQRIETSVPTQSASGFAVPAANGCGFRGVLNHAINSKVGLPSPAGGENSVVFNEATNYLVLVVDESLLLNDGKELSKAWHSAVVAPEGGGHG